jgi:hypothetical protein
MLAEFVRAYFNFYRDTIGRGKLPASYTSEFPGFPDEMGFNFDQNWNAISDVKYPSLT